MDKMILQIPGKDHGQNEIANKDKGQNDVANTW